MSSGSFGKLAPNNRPLTPSTAAPPILTGIRRQSAKSVSSAKDLSGVASGVSLVPTVATEIDSDDGMGDGIFADESSQQEGRRQGRWPAAEDFPREFGGGGGGDGSAGDGRSVDANEDEEEGSGGSPSVVGQYVEISSDEESDRGATGRASGSRGKTLEDVEGGYPMSASVVGPARIKAGKELGGEEEAREGEEALIAEGKGRSRPARKLRLRLPSKGDMLIYGGFLLNVSTKGTISWLETIGAQYAMTKFLLSSAEVREAGGRT